MNCPACAAPNEPGRSFCGTCGAALPWRCGCGFANAGGTRFCGGCGARLAAPAVAAPDSGESGKSGDGHADGGERRQVVVLFADLAGFTKLSAGLDPEETHALLERFFTVADRTIQDHGGHVDKHIGDCVMGLFGAPTAHADDADRAIRAALALHAAVAALPAGDGGPLAVHSGIAMGEVVAGGTGSSSHRSYTVTGDAVNLAARLADQAEAGQILAAPAVLVALRGAALGSVMAPVELPGIAQPVAPFRVEGIALPPAATVFVGRKAELDRIEALLADCVAHRSGSLLVLRGEAGIGKTALAAQLVERAAARGFRCHSAAVLDFGGGEGRDAGRLLFRDLLGVTATAPMREAAMALERALATGLVAPGRQVFANDLLGLPQPARLRARYDLMGNAERQDGKVATLAEVALQAATAQPRLLLVEDLHWAGPYLLPQLSALARAARTGALMTVLTTRPDGDPLDAAWCRQLDGTRMLTLDLAPLPNEDAWLLAAAMAAPVETQQRCVARAGGNPLFLEQLLRHAAGQGDSIPATVQSLVQARLDRLSPVQRRVMQAASVLGQRFAPEALDHLLEGVVPDLAGLLEQGLLRRQGQELMFSHALIRDAVRASLLRRQARALHRRIADWLEGRDNALRAEHLDLATDPAAALAYLAAAREQAALYHADRARQLAMRGLELAASEHDRALLGCCLGQILLDRGEPQAARETFATVLAQTADPLLRCRARLGLAEALRLVDRLDDALQLLDEAQPELERLDEAEALARLHHLRGNLCFPRGEVERCVCEHQAALLAAERSGEVELVARALGGLGDAEYVRGHMRSALAAFSRCTVLARQHGLGRIESANLPMVAITRSYTLDLATAREEASMAIQLGRETGNQRGQIIALHAASIVRLLTGDLDGIEDEIAQAREITGRIGARRFEPENLLFLAETRLQQGRDREAAELANEAMTLGREVAMSYLGPALLGMIARTASSKEQRAAALAEGEQLLARGTISHNVLWFRRNAMDDAILSGAWTQARHHADALAAYTQAEPMPWSDLLVARARALASWGEGSPEARTQLDEVAGRLRSCGALTLLPPVTAALTTGRG